MDRYHKFGYRNVLCQVKHPRLILLRFCWWIAKVIVLGTIFIKRFPKVDGVILIIASSLSLNIIFTTYYYYLNLLLLANIAVMWEVDVVITGCLNTHSLSQYNPLCQIWNLKPSVWLLQSTLYIWEIVIITILLTYNTAKNICVKFNQYISISTKAIVCTERWKELTGRHSEINSPHHSNGSIALRMLDTMT